MNLLIRVEIGSKKHWCADYKNIGVLTTYLEYRLVSEKKKNIGALTITGVHKLVSKKTLVC